MSSATLSGPLTILAPPETIMDLLERLGDIPPSRIRLKPPPGTATEDDVIEAEAKTGRHCELVDGTLVEKAVGYYEDLLGSVLIELAGAFARKHKLGFLLGAAGLMRPRPGLVRIPDVAFYSWSQFPNRRLPRVQILGRIPDLAVEVLSPSNTEKEMDRKRREYFNGGASLVWQVYPETEQVRVYTAINMFKVFGENQTLTGGTVLPGFKLSVRRWFKLAGQREE